jgi:hypothetical protein
MILSPFVEFPDPARVTPGEAKRVGPAPKCRSSAFTEAPEKSFRRTSEQDFEGNRNPKGDLVEAEEQAAAGRRNSPEAVTEQKAGYRTEYALWTKAPI